jgi:hypothetical protein
MTWDHTGEKCEIANNIILTVFPGLIGSGAPSACVENQQMVHATERR